MTVVVAFSRGVALMKLVAAESCLRREWENSEVIIALAQSRRWVAVKPSTSRDDDVGNHQQ